MAEQKYEAPEARMESPNTTPVKSDFTSDSRASRGKQAKAAAAAYVKECESVAAGMFSVSGKKRSKGY